MYVFQTDHPLTRGAEIRLARTALGLRQFDVATKATAWLQAQGPGFDILEVSPAIVSRAERDGPVRTPLIRAIFAVLGLEGSVYDEQ